MNTNLVYERPSQSLNSRDLMTGTGPRTLNLMTGGLNLMTGGPPYTKSNDWDGPRTLNLMTGTALVH